MDTQGARGRFPVAARLPIRRAAFPIAGSGPALSERDYASPRCSGPTSKTTPRYSIARATCSIERRIPPGKCRRRVDGNTTTDTTNFSDFSTVDETRNYFSAEGTQLRISGANVNYSRRGDRHLHRARRDKKFSTPATPTANAIQARSSYFTTTKPAFMEAKATMARAALPISMAMPTPSSYPMVRIEKSLTG